MTRLEWNKAVSFAHQTVNELLKEGIHCCYAEDDSKKMISLNLIDSTGSIFAAYNTGACESYEEMEKTLKELKDQIRTEHKKPKTSYLLRLVTAKEIVFCKCTVPKTITKTDIERELKKCPNTVKNQADVEALMSQIAEETGWTCDCLSLDLNYCFF